MTSCGCSQNGGGSKRCSCKKCRHYSQRGGSSIFDNIGNIFSKTVNTAKEVENKVQNSLYPNNQVKTATDLASLNPVIPHGKGGGKRRTRKNRKSRKSRKSRRIKKSRKYRR